MSDGQLRRRSALVTCHVTSLTPAMEILRLEMDISGDANGGLGYLHMRTITRALVESKCTKDPFPRGNYSEKKEGTATLNGSIRGRVLLLILSQAQCLQREMVEQCSGCRCCGLVVACWLDGIGFVACGSDMFWWGQGQGV